MVSFKTAFHSVTGRSIIELYDNSGKFVAGIYPDDDGNGIRIVSDYFDAVDFRQLPLAQVIVTFKPRES